MAITTGSLNPHLAPLPRASQEPGKPKGGPLPAKEGKAESRSLAGPQKASTPPASAPVDGEAVMGEELGLMKQDLEDLKQGKKPLDNQALPELKDGFATKQVAAARQVQQVGPIADSRFQGRTASHQDAVSLERMGSSVKPRSESAMPEDLALLDMSEEQLGEKVDLTKLTDSTRP